MIELTQVARRYGQTAVLKSITLSIDEPDIYCLLGRNGTGYIENLACYKIMEESL